MVPSSSRFIGSLLPPGKNNHHAARFPFSGFYHSIREFTILIVELCPKSTWFVAWPVKKISKITKKSSLAGPSPKSPPTPLS
jgi:hypothetical protein